MKIPPLNSVEAALEHADDAEVLDQLHDFLTRLDEDLTDNGYEPGVLVEQAAARLDLAVGEAANRSDEKVAEGGEGEND